MDTRLEGRARLISFQAEENGRVYAGTIVVGELTGIPPNQFVDELRKRIESAEERGYFDDVSPLNAFSKEYPVGQTFVLKIHVKQTDNPL